MEDAQSIGIVLSLCGAIGWIFKVWILDPLNISVNRLNDSINKIESIIENIRSQNAETLQKIAALEETSKIGHKRIDDLADRIRELEARCLDCRSCKDD